MAISFMNQKSTMVRDHGQLLYSQNKTRLSQQAEPGSRLKGQDFEI